MASKIPTQESKSITPCAGTVPLLTVDGDNVSITDQQFLAESKSFVGFMGPPGAGKSSLCNTVVHHQYKVPATIFFEPSKNYKSFTKGLWMLAVETKRAFSNGSDWEVLDMEGFQYRSEACWKMAMVMSVLAEIVFFCNRNARADVLIEAAEVFAKGMKLCEALSMSPVTKQVFIQVDSELYENGKMLNELIQEIEGILHNSSIQVIPFCLPEIRDADMRELPFTPMLIKSVGTLCNEFRFEKNGQAAAAKMNQLASLLKAFKQRDFRACDGHGLMFLEMDCKRIYEKAEATKRTQHHQLASNKSLTSPDITFEQFMDAPNWSLDLPFEKSQFYKEKYEQHVKEWYPVGKRVIPMPEIYLGYYNSKKAELTAKLEMEKLQRQAEIDMRKAEELGLLQKVNLAIKDARIRLQKRMQEVEDQRPIYNDWYFSDWESFVVQKREVENYANAMKPSMKADFWSPFKTHYDNEKQRIKDAWNEQIKRAQWVSPVQAMGELKCQNGHKLTDYVVCHKTSCRGKLFWSDGPHRVAICQGCNENKKMSDSLECTGCGAAAKCTTRPSEYIP